MSLYGSLCKLVSGNTKAASEDIIAKEFLVNKLINKKFPIDSNTQEIFKNVNARIDQYPDGTVITEKIVNSVVIQEVNKWNKGKKKKKNPVKLRMIYKIHSMLAGNEILLKSFIDKYNFTVLKARGLKITPSERKKLVTRIKEGADVYIALNLDEASIEILQSLYQDVYKTHNSSGDAMFTGWKGSLRRQYGLPRTNLKWDPTGGLNRAIEASLSYVSKVSTHVNKWMSSGLQRGMQDVYTGKKNSVTKIRAFSPRDKLRMIQVFNRIMKGQMFIKHTDKDGKEFDISELPKDPNERAKKIKDLGLKSQLYIHARTDELTDSKLGLNKQYYYYKELTKKVFKYLKQF